MNKSEKLRNLGGRPSIYSTGVVNQICERIAMGKSLRKICDNDDMPDYSTVFRWLKDNAEFQEQYARAREDQADTIYAEIMEIEELLQGGKIEPNAARVLGDLKRWRAARMKPKVYGDAKHIEVKAGFDFRHLTDAQIEERLNKLLAEYGTEMIEHINDDNQEVETSDCEDGEIID